MIADFFEDFDNWSKLRDIDGDGLPDCVEQYLGSNPEMKDTDSDGLDDYYEVFVTYTDPVKPDSDDNGINDGDEDFDEDSLTNLEEYTLSTNPWNDDSDGDELKDGEEINTYGTDPLKKDTDDDGLEDNDEIHFVTDPTNPDTDGNGILDGDEKYSQTFTHIVKNEECAVEEVIVSMEGTGNIQKNTSVESVMDEDIICSDVVGLIGEPFEIESKSQFDKATITFKINQSRLGDTEFDNLMFLWYDEENYKFVELETSYDYDNSTVSIETSHFSRYMVVDKNKWFEAWAVEFNYNPNNKDSHAPTYRYNTVLAVDCSGSMRSNDPISTVSGIDSPYEAAFSKTCQRIKAAESFVNNMNNVDKAAVVLFTSSASIATGMTDDSQTLKLALQKITSSGNTSFNAAISTSISAFDSSEFHGTDITNRIILLSDGGSSVSESILNNARDAGIEIYTIGLGSGSNDSVLKHISDYTGGKFFKAYTSDDLVDIYSKVGFSDFDTTDTDGDKLYDAVEAAGIRIQNGQIITGCDPSKKDTNNDGLEDGQEIDPTPLKSEKTIYNDDGTVETVKGYYFTMTSNPEKTDTDNDGYDDYSFLNNEIYSIGLYDYINGNSFPLESGASENLFKSDTYIEKDEQYFKFVWCGNGYKIFPISYEESGKVLTITKNDSSYDITIEDDENSLSQIWEVLPYNYDEYCLKFEDGILLRNKMYREINDTYYSQFLSCSSGKICAVTDRTNETRCKIYSPSYWHRFGEAYLNYLGWENTGISPYAMSNYFSNVDKGINNPINIEIYNGNNMLINQSNGNFKNLMFNNVTMDGVCCEIMGTYNAMILAGVDVDFFKLAIEFEMNATKIIAGLTICGTWGSDPYKIDDCLDAYHVKYVTIDMDNYESNEQACDAFDSELKSGKSAIISYHFPSFKFIYAGIHTYASIYDDIIDSHTPILTFNRYSNFTTSAKYHSTYEALTCSTDSHYMIGYVLQY